MWYYLIIKMNFKNGFLWQGAPIGWDESLTLGEKSLMYSYAKILQYIILGHSQDMEKNYPGVIVTQYIIGRFICPTSPSHQPI